MLFRNIMTVIWPFFAKEWFLNFYFEDLIWFRLNWIGSSNHELDPPVNRNIVVKNWSNNATDIPSFECQATVSLTQAENKLLSVLLVTFSVWRNQ